MSKNICIEFLNSFSEKEMGALRHLVTCSYFNRDKTIVKLLDIIRQDVWCKRQFNTDIQRIIYEKLFNVKILNIELSELEKKRLSTKMSVLTRLGEQYLKLEALNENKAYSSNLLLQKILEKQQYRLFKQHINKDRKSLESQSHKDALHHQHQQLIEENTLNYLHRSGELLNHDNLNELMYQTDIQYFLRKLSLYMTELFLQNISSRTYDTTSVELMYSMLDLPQYASHPLVQIYRASINLMQQASEKNYRQLLTMLHDNENAIPKSDLNGFYVAATNFCAEQIRQGRFDYQELFDLYKIMDKKNLLVEDSFIPVNKLKNVVAMGCRLSEFDWAMQIIEKYQSFVEKQVRESVYHFNFGVVAFYQKDYKKALHHFVRVESVNFNYDANCRVIIMKAHYETGQEYDERTLQIFRSTEKYFNKNQQLTSRNKKAYKNFIRTLINIYRVRHQATKMKLESIKEKLDRQEVNSDKKWLAEKIEELTNKQK